MPITRSRGKPETRRATSHMASSGLVTMMRMVSGERETSWRTTSETIAVFFASRSSRLMPGLRARPAVTTQTCEPAVGS